MLYRTRELLKRQRAMTLMTVHAHLVEFSITTAQGLHRMQALSTAINAGEAPSLPQIAVAALESQFTQLNCVSSEIRTLERQFMGMAPPRLGEHMTASTGFRMTRELPLY